MWQHLISISEMAKLHGLTRQTLIHYDTIGLFKPIEVDDKGYRYYSRRQIPFLREICFLKALGIGLKEIMTHLQDRDPQREKVLLERHKKVLMQEIAHLKYLRDAINQRMSLYEEAAEADAMHMTEPFIKYYEPRRVIFKPFELPVDKEQLHVTLMDLWREVFSHEFLPSRGFGTLLQEESVRKGNYLTGAGSYIVVSDETHALSATYVSLPAGNYACMYKYGMPYDTEHVIKLMDWMHKEGLEIGGTVVDVCLLDTTFYQQDHSKDFCMLQIPIKGYV